MFSLSFLNGQFNHNHYFKFVFIISLFFKNRALGIRKSPKMTLDNWKELAPVGVFTALAHAFSVLALGAGMS